MYSVSNHELWHLDGADDNYIQNDKGQIVNSGNGVMGSASQNFAMDAINQERIVTNYLFIARRAHELLLGKNIGQLKENYSPITSPDQFNEKSIH